MKKGFTFCIILLLLTVHISLAQTNYYNLLVRDNRTCWATAASIVGPEKVGVEYDDSIHFESKQCGICLGRDGYFEWYEISDENDTLPMILDDYTRFFVSHFTYELHNDTLFIKSRYKPNVGYDTERGPYEYKAYKILYLTEQKMLLLGLRKDNNDNWIEETYPPDHKSTVIEYRYMKPQDLWLGF